MFCLDGSELNWDFFEEIVKPKMKILLLFTHAIPNLCLVEHKNRSLETIFMLHKFIPYSYSQQRQVLLKIKSFKNDKNSFIKPHLVLLF